MLLQLRFAGVAATRLILTSRRGLNVSCPLTLPSLLSPPQAEEDRRWVNANQRFVARQAEVMKNVRRCCCSFAAALYLVGCVLCKMLDALYLSVCATPACCGSCVAAQCGTYGPQLLWLYCVF